MFGLDDKRSETVLENVDQQLAVEQLQQPLPSIEMRQHLAARIQGQCTAILQREVQALARTGAQSAQRQPAVGQPRDQTSKRHNANQRQGIAQKAPAARRCVEGVQQAVAGHAAQFVIVQHGRNAAHHVEDFGTPWVALTPATERLVLLSTGVPGLQQRHPLRRLVDDRLIRRAVAHGCVIAR